jgi:hypoxanthine phosphoribosyltransferase
MMLTLNDYRGVVSRSQLIVPGGAMEDAMDRMAREINSELASLNPLVVCVMTGGIVAAGQLLPRLGFPLQLDYLHLTRYRGKTSGGRLVWTRRPGEVFRGRHILLVDDILDEGLTLAAAADACGGGGALSVRSAVLVEKDRRRARDFRADFVGVTVPDRYVFGYGLDFRGYFRNAAGIYAVAEEDL